LLRVVNFILLDKINNYIFAFKKNYFVQSKLRSSMSVHFHYAGKT